MPRCQLQHRGTYEQAKRSEGTTGLRRKGDPGDVQQLRALHDESGNNQPVGNRRVSLDPYTHVNFRVEYTVRWIQLHLKVENAFDDQTPEISSFKPRGRTVWFGARTTFGR